MATITFGEPSMAFAPWQRIGDGAAGTTLMHADRCLHPAAVGAAPEDVSGTSRR